MWGTERESGHSFLATVFIPPESIKWEVPTALLGRACHLLLVMVVCVGFTNAQDVPVVLDRDGGTIVLEPYAPNIIRVSLSLRKDRAVAAPGYGFVATPAAEGWKHQQSEEADVYRSARLVVTVAVNRPGKPMATEVDIAKFFNGSAPRSQHFDPNARRQDAAPNGGLVDVRAQSQRRQRRYVER